MTFTAVDGQCIFHLVVTVIILEVSRPGRYEAVAELVVANVDLYKMGRNDYSTNAGSSKYLLQNTKTR